MSSGLFDNLPVQKAAERGQVELRAVSLDDLVPADHRVRLVWSFVEGLDLSALMAEIKAVAGRPGHPPADPRILMSLWLFATIEGIGSARAFNPPVRRQPSLPVAVRRRGHEPQDAVGLPGELCPKVGYGVIRRHLAVA